MLILVIHAIEITKHVQEESNNHQHEIPFRQFLFNFEYPWQGYDFSPDGTKIVFYSQNIINILDLATGECICTINNGDRWHKDYIELIYFKDNNTVTTCSEDCTIRTWNITTGECVREFLLTDEKGAFVMCRNSDGTRIVTRTHQGVKVWDANDGTFICQTAEPACIDSIYYGPNDEQLISNCGGNLVFWDPENGSLIKTIFSEHPCIDEEDIVYPRLNSNKKPVFYSESKQSYIDILFVGSRENLDGTRSYYIVTDKHYGDKDDIVSSGFNPNNNIFFYYTRKSIITLIDVQSGKRINWFSSCKRSEAIGCHPIICFNNDGSLFSISRSSNLITIINTQTGKIIHTLSHHQSDSKIENMHWLSNDFLISRSLDQVNIWDIKAGVCVYTIKPAQSSWNFSLLSPSNYLILGEFGTYYTFDLNAITNQS